MEILLGSDPEMFVYKNGKPISAFGMVKGSKEHPLVVKDGAVQVDGMALEYNTDPVNNLKDWEHHHVSVQKQLAGMIDKNLELRATPTAFFSDKVFKSSPEEALMLGCEADYNAYTQRANPTPDADVKFRTGAGHIHIGWTKDADIRDPFHLGECYALVRYLDVWLGIPSIVMDKDYKRRELYGKAGAFRPKSYGLEYRTLSNFWVDTPELRAWAYNGTMSAINRALSGEYINSHTNEVIDNNDVALAKAHINIHNLDTVGV